MKITNEQKKVLIKLFRVFHPSKVLPKHLQGYGVIYEK